MQPDYPQVSDSVQISGINQRHYWLHPIFRIVLVAIGVAVIVAVLHHLALFAIEQVQFTIVLFFAFAFFETVIYATLLGTRSGRLRIANGLLYFQKFDASPGFQQPAGPINPVDLAHLTRAVYRKGRLASRAPVPRVGALTIYVPASVTITDSNGASAEVPMWGWTGQKRLAATLLYSLRQTGAEVDENAASLLQKRAKNYSGPLADSSDDRFHFFYISDAVVAKPRATLIKARLCEAIFGLSFIAALLLMQATLTPASYKHFNATIAIVNVLSGAVISFVIFFLWLGAYTRKLAGHVSPNRNIFIRMLPSAVLATFIGGQFGIDAMNNANQTFSADTNLYIMATISSFVVVLSAAFIVICHTAVKKVHNSRSTNT